MPTYQAEVCGGCDAHCGLDGTEGEPCWGELVVDEVNCDDEWWWDHWCEGHEPTRDGESYKPETSS